MNSTPSTPAHPLVACTADCTMAAIAAIVFSTSLLALQKTALLMSGQLAGVSLLAPLRGPLTYPVDPPVLSLTPEVVLANRATVLFLIASAVLLTHALAKLTQRLHRMLNIRDF